MFSTKFGIEIELTGITRSKAVVVTKEVLGGTITSMGGVHTTYRITTADGRISWL